MYEYCTRCGCRDIRKVSQHCGYATFECEDCGYSFDIVDCYLEFDYDSDGRKDADEEDY